MLDAFLSWQTIYFNIKDFQQEYIILKVFIRVYLGFLLLLFVFLDHFVCLQYFRALELCFLKTNTKIAKWIKLSHKIQWTPVLLGSGTQFTVLILGSCYCFCKDVMSQQLSNTNYQTKILVSNLVLRLLNHFTIWYYLCYMKGNLFIKSNNYLLYSRKLKLSACSLAAT